MIITKRQVQGISRHFNWHIIFQIYLHCFSAISAPENYYLLLILQVASWIAISLSKWIRWNFYLLPFLFHLIQIQTVYTYLFIKRIATKYKHFTKSNRTCACITKLLISAWQITPILKFIQLFTLAHLITSIVSTKSNYYFTIIKLCERKVSSL